MKAMPCIRLKNCKYRKIKKIESDINLKSMKVSILYFLIYLSYLIYFLPTALGSAIISPVYIINSPKTTG